MAVDRRAEISREHSRSYRVAEGPNKLGTVIMQERHRMAPVEQRELCLPMAEGELMTGDCVEPRSMTSSSLIARVLERENLIHALKQVKHFRDLGLPELAAR
jgi:hypothetical protein